MLALQVEGMRTAASIVDLLELSSFGAAEALAKELVRICADCRQLQSVRERQLEMALPRGELVTGSLNFGVS